MNFIESIKNLRSVQVIDDISTWQDSIRMSFQPLLDQDIITENYIMQTIKKGQELNFYFLIAPHLGMPHSRPEDGVNKTGVSLLIIKKGIKFENHQNNPIYCLIGLAALDNNQHIDVLMQISELFGENEDLIDRLRQVENKDEIINILEQELKNGH